MKEAPQNQSGDGQIILGYVTDKAKHYATVARLPPGVKNETKRNAPGDQPQPTRWSRSHSNLQEAFSVNGDSARSHGLMKMKLRCFILFSYRALSFPALSTRCGVTPIGRSATVNSPQMQQRLFCWRVVEAKNPRGRLQYTLSRVFVVHCNFGMRWRASPLRPSPWLPHTELCPFGKFWRRRRR